MFFAAAEERGDNLLDGRGETGQDRGKTGSEEIAGACEESCPGSPHRSMVLSPQQNPRS